MEKFCDQQKNKTKIENKFIAEQTEKQTQKQHDNK